MAGFLLATIPTASLATPFITSPESKTHLFQCPRKSLASRRFPKLTPLHVAASPSSSSAAAERASDQKQEEIRVRDEFDEESSESKFSWKDHWYPVSLVEDLDPSLPTPFQLLGLDLVLWFDKGMNQWVAFDDKCPHRLAPLSEGRIDENGHLQCSYHGWSFAGCGSCTRIPQAASQGPEARANQSPRACATRFPTMVSQGLLFVWPDENGQERASATEPPMLPDDFSKPEFATVNIQRDLFYGYDTLMENVSDPSHIDFAHHKVTGRRDRAKPLPFKVESSGPWGFGGSNEGNPKISSKFVAPCYYMNKIEIDTKLPIVGEQKWKIWICSFNVPMAPGKTRSIVCSARNFFQFSVPGPAWWQVVPRWFEHWTSNKVYDGDMIVLQGQEKIFLSKSMESSEDINKQYTQLTFTPTQADRFVLEFRKWLRRHGNSQPEWLNTTIQQPLPSTVLSKRQMMDRFEQHTLKCSSCKQAYTSFQTWKKILIGATIAFSASAGIPSEFQLRVVLAVLAVASAGLAFALHQLEKNFIFVDYVHAEIE
ncbi:PHEOPHORBIDE A OXYGENASE, LETHAL LEAF-SPOT 1 HOMOLOG, ACCELERATED CELL DEATH 1 [Hibiscus trionum]|uniref:PHEOPHORBIDE A OXYGENASE, LETHAL LEAF-SPOT 1 HOMOLOG, ACCELERATED CELL DEATH 1 n=1 Tax=Hibiscus trionum TaxID=183268 RepID=A0A9W7MD69_HIBTR|nr:PHEOPHORBIDE A OXYGENASE, LETHAL LEAF-SPOT 1 HOMOLOG, ACCELERATED CELL DEATH 1 [Hibiscus trionum]